MIATERDEVRVANWRAVAVIIALLSLVLAACSDSSPKHAAGAGSGMPTAGTHSTTSTAPVAVEVTRIELPGTEADHVAIWDGHVAWGAAPDGHNLTEIQVLDLHANRVTTVAKTSFPHGQTDWARGSGNTIVYTDQQHETSDEQPTTPWKINIVDLRTGATETIARSAGRSGDYTPLPVIDGPWVVWDEAVSITEDAVVAFNVETRARHQLVRVSEIGSVSVDNGLVVYDAPSGAGRRDVFAVPIDGTTGPKQLSNSGQVTYAVAANAHVTWQEPAAGDPTSIWAVDEHGGQPTEVVAGPNYGNAVAGQSFVVWFGQQHPLQAVDLEGRRTVVVSSEPISVPARAAAWHDLVAWGLLRFTGDMPTTTIVVSRLRFPAPTTN